MVSRGASSAHRPPSTAHRSLPTAHCFLSSVFRLLKFPSSVIRYSVLWFIPSSVLRPEPAPSEAQPLSGSSVLLSSGFFLLTVRSPPRGASTIASSASSWRMRLRKSCQTPSWRSSTSPATMYTWTHRRSWCRWQPGSLARMVVCRDVHEIMCFFFSPDDYSIILWTFPRNLEGSHKRFLHPMRFRPLSRADPKVVPISLPSFQLRHRTLQPLQLIPPFLWERRLLSCHSR